MDFSLRYYRTAYLVTAVVLLSAAIDWVVASYLVPSTSGSIRMPTNGALILGFLYIYNRWLWKYPVLRILVKVPDLSGRYEGRIVFTFDGVKGEKECAIEIYQSASELKISMFNQQYGGEEQTSSKSVIEEVVLDNGNYELWFAYRNSGNPNTSLDPHDGLNVLKVLETKKKKKRLLKGFYFTNRIKQTRGEIEVRYKSNNKINRL